MTFMRPILRPSGRMGAHDVRNVCRASLGALVVVVLLGVVEPASAASGREKRISHIVATVAGRPVAVSCQLRSAAWRQEVAAGHLAPGAVAYYDPEPDLVRFGPLICRDLLRLERGVVTLASVRALFMAAHEAAHAAGVEDEGVANCWGLYWAQDLARRFTGIAFHSPLSRRVRAYARQTQEDSPAEYRAACPV